MDLTQSFHGYHVRLATEQDSLGLGKLLASIHSEGSMPLIEQRGDSFFELLHMHLGQSITFVIERNSEIIGCISNIIRKGWFDGELIDIAYTCDLRVKTQHRKKVKLTPMYQHMIDVIKQQYDVDVFFCSVLYTNAKGIKATNLARANVMSRYSMKSIQFVGDVKSAKHKVARAEQSDLNDIADFLQCHAKKRVFGFQQDADTLAARINLWPNFSINDFYLIRNEESRIVATAAPWDTQPLRQTCLLAYHGGMRWLKYLYNIEAQIRNFEPLPKAGGCFHYATLTHVEIEDDDPSLLNSLLKTIYQDLRYKNLHMMSMMLVDDSPLKEAFKGFRTRETPFELRVFQHPESHYDQLQFQTSRPGFEMALH